MVIKKIVKFSDINGTGYDPINQGGCPPLPRMVKGL